MASNPRAATPPLLRGLPVLGNTVDALRDVCGLLEQGYHQHGPVFRLRRLGREAVVLAGIEANEFFLANDSALFYSRDVYHHLAREGGADHTFIALDGPDHRHLRDQLRLGYSRQLVAGAIPDLVAQVQAQAQSWQPGQTFDVLTIMANLLADQAGGALLSHTLAPEDYAPLLAFCKTFVGVGVDIQPPILLRRPAYQRAKRHFFAMMDGVFAAHGKSGECPVHDQIDLARRARYADGRQLSETDARANTYYSYVMNTVYTNRLCANMLYALLKDPALLARAQAEVDAVCEAGPVDLLALRRLPVLRATMREALRLYPIVAGIPRHVKQDFEFGGYQIRSGQKVYIAASVTHVLPEFFPNPHQFDADRFLPPRDEHHHPRAYLPFGAGAHACMGASLATLFTLTTMVGVLRAARFAIDPASYVVRRVADPMPGPNGFRVRVLPFAPRKAAASPAQPAAPTAADEDLALRDAPSLDRAEQDRLLASAEPQTFAPGATIIREGDPADAFYILARGSAEVLRERPDAPPELLAQLADGAYFGEVGLLQDRPRTATVRAGAGGAEVLAMARDAFLRYVAQFDLVGDEIAALIRRRAISRGLAQSLPTLTPAQIAQVAPEVAPRIYAPGEPIIRQGERAETFYILTRGRAEVLRQYPGGQSATIDWREPGEYFGEIGLLQDRPRTATVRAAEGGAEVLELGRAAFQRMIGASVATESAVAREMARRLIALAH